MRIAYLSYPYFADTDLSIIRAMRAKADLYYFIIITPNSLRSTAIDIQEQHSMPGIFKANIYPEIAKFSEFIDIEKTYVVNIRGNKTNYENFSVFFKLALMLRRMNIDILHTTMYYIRIPMFPLFFLGRKTVLTVHDPLPHSDAQTDKRDSLYRKITFKLIRNFIILNENQKSEFVSRYKLKKKNIYISRLGIYDYLRRYVKSTLVENDVNEEYILFFGRITDYKGLDFLFPAMKTVNETHKNVKLIAAGYCKDYYFDISEYENCSYIEIMNKFIPDNELAVLIRKSLFVVCPYIDATQSGVVMSAFALNVPVLATNVGGLSNYVEHMKSGYIVEPKNAGALANGIKYLLDNRESLNEYRKYIEKKYETWECSWDKITDDILVFYEGAVTKNKRVKNDT